MNWVVWAWVVLVFFTLFQICAMFVGVSQAMKLVTGIEVLWWVLAFFVLTLGERVLNERCCGWARLPWRHFNFNSGRQCLLRHAWVENQ